MNLCGIPLKKPIMNASGTLSKENLEEVKDIYGALVTKTVTLEPREGNPPPRLAETPCGMVNSIGLQNPGIERFLEEDLEEWDVGLPIIVSVAASTIRDFVDMCSRAADHPLVAGIELNLSCPNAYDFGMPFCANPENVEMVVEACHDELAYRDSDSFHGPLIAKLAAENAIYNAQWAEEYGADAITLINTIPALTYLSDVSEPILGGLSGPAIKPIALRAVYEVSRRVNVPVIGCGGVSSRSDVEEFMRAGASAVQVGSGSFVKEPKEIVKEMTDMEELKKALPRMTDEQLNKVTQAHNADPFFRV